MDRAAGSTSSAILRREREDPELLERLVGSLQGSLEREYGELGRRQFHALREQAGAGDLERWIWRHPSGAQGIAYGQEREGGIRLFGVWVSAPAATSVPALLEDLSREREKPIDIVTDLIAGFSRGEQRAWFLPKGYWHRAKVLLRRPGALPPPPSPNRTEIRPIRPEDFDALVDVYARAYTERPGEFWVISAPLPVEDAGRSLSAHLASGGAWDPHFSPGASFVWDRAGVLLGAVLVEQGPSGSAYVSDLIVEPTVHRHGIGRALLERALAALAREGAGPVDLAAIRFGAPYRLYVSLGFREVGSATGSLDGVWVRGPDPTGRGDPD